jgi:transitional endoplasmic reticulum ATPase
MRQSFIFSPSYSTSSALHLAISAFQSSLSHNDSVLVFNRGHWEPDNDLYASIQKASWDDVVLDRDLAERVRAEYTSFLKSEEVYKGMGVPWKRGLMFLGVSAGPDA